MDFQIKEVWLTIQKMLIAPSCYVCGLPQTPLWSRFAWFGNGEEAAGILRVILDHISPHGLGDAPRSRAMGPCRSAVRGLGAWVLMLASLPTCLVYMLLQTTLTSFGFLFLNYEIRIRANLVLWLRSRGFRIRQNRVQTATTSSVTSHKPVFLSEPPHLHLKNGLPAALAPRSL